MIRSPFEIPGCKLHWESSYFDRHPKAREIVQVRLNSLATCEAMAQVYSYIVFPGASKEEQRNEFSIAMARWAVLERVHIEREWGERSDMNPSIRPVVFSQPDFLNIYTRGAKTLYRRLVLGCMMLLPHIMENEEINGLSPTVGNIALGVALKLGNSEESQKTVESRIWAPVKPVVHVAAAAMYFMGSFAEMREFWDDGRHPLCFRQPMLATLFYEDVARYILMLAEILRVQLPDCTRFRVGEADTIRFVLDRLRTNGVSRQTASAA